jgi:lipid II isoglutaminyl synthase (glutamine-hydrolysing)
MIRIAVVFPDLLGTYGDGGNGAILLQRALWRGYDAELLQAESGTALPAADIYCIGGGEDGPQVRAARELIDCGDLVHRVSDGAAVLAVCAGFQIVGMSFPGSDGANHDGVGLLDVVTHKGDGVRAVGELAAEVTEEAHWLLAPFEPPVLSGFENHGGRTALGADVVPLARVAAGVGNGDGSANEGALRDRVIGTYLHGPVLARNPVLADRLLAWALDVEALAPLNDEAAEDLRNERLSLVGQTTTKRRSFRRH